MSDHDDLLARWEADPDSVGPTGRSLLIIQLAAALRAARADRVCWRETHNQVAAERDALATRVEQAEAEHEWLLDKRLCGCGDELRGVLGATCGNCLVPERQGADHIREERDALRGVVRRTMRDWTLVSDIDGDVWSSPWEPEIPVTPAEADAIRRALDASPTEGNPE